MNIYPARADMELLLSTLRACEAGFVNLVKQEETAKRSQEQLCARGRQAGRLFGELLSAAFVQN